MQCLSRNDACSVASSRGQSWSSSVTSNTVSRRNAHRCRPSLYRLTFVIDHLIDRSPPAQCPQQLYRWPKCVSDFQWSRRNSLRSRGGRDATSSATGAGRHDALGVMLQKLRPVTDTSATSCGQSASTVNLMAAAQLTTVRWTNRWRHAAAGQLSCCRRAHLGRLSFPILCFTSRLVVVVVASTRP